MRRHLVLSLLVSTILVIASLALLPVGVQAHEEDDEDELVGTLDWLFGDDLDPVLALFGVPAFGPAAAVDEDGNRIEISGHGTFTLSDDDEAVTGGGTYKIFDASGSLIAEGTWTMTEFEEFDDFGGVPTPLGFFRGGILEAEIELEGLGEGEIVIFCLFGSPPPGLIEGVAVDTDEMDFEDVVEPVPGPAGGGFTFFIGP